MFLECHVRVSGNTSSFSTGIFAVYFSGNCLGALKVDSIRWKCWEHILIVNSTKHLIHSGVRKVQYVNPQMVKNTLWLWGVPKDVKFVVSLPLSIRRLPYWDGETKWLIILIWWFSPEFQMVTKTLWKWVRDWIVPPIWKRGCVNPRFHTVIPIWKWGSWTFQSPYGNGD